ETVAPVLGSAYCIMPSYRAEKSRTSRHLSEYTHVEAELVDITFDGLTSAIEKLIRDTTKKFYADTLTCIQAVYPDFKPIEYSEEPFKRLKYADAIAFLIEKDNRKPNGEPYRMMDDIC